MCQFLGFLYSQCNAPDDVAGTKSLEQEVTCLDVGLLEFVCCHLCVCLHVEPCHIIYIYILARPVELRGGLRAFQKCTAEVASSKGRQNLESLRLTV